MVEINPEVETPWKQKVFGLSEWNKNSIMLSKKGELVQNPKLCAAVQNLRKRRQYYSGIS